MGNIKRYYTSCIIDKNDTYCYVGTKSGDILEFLIENAIFKRYGPLKSKL